MLAGSAPRPSWASVATSPLPPTWPPGGWACRSCCTSRTSSGTGQPAGRPSHPPRSRPSRPPPGARDLHRVADAAQHHRAEPGCAPRTGAGYVRSAGPGRRAAGQRRLAGCGQHQPGGTRGEPGPAGRRYPVLHVLGARNITSDDVRNTLDTGAVPRSPTLSRWSRRARGGRPGCSAGGAGTVMETAVVGCLCLCPTCTATASRPAMQHWWWRPAVAAADRRRLHLRMGGERDPGTARRPERRQGNERRLGRRCSTSTPRRCWRSGTLR